MLSTEDIYKFVLDDYDNLIESGMDLDKVLELNGNHMPLGLSIDQLEALELPYHVFIYYDNYLKIIRI